MSTRQHSLAAFLSLGLVLAALPSVATAGVVYGNLGNSGTNAINTGDTAIVGSSVEDSPGNSYAIAFSTGSSGAFLTLNSISLGLSDIEPFSTALLTVVEDNAGFPTGSQVASASQLLGPTGLYTFTLGSVDLNANSTYWVTVTALNATDANQFNWLRNDALATVNGLNGSGYTAPTIVARRSTDGGATWPTNFTPSGATLSMNINAVPEPSTYAMAAAGAGLFGLMQWRRRKQG